MLNNSIFVRCTIRYTLKGIILKDCQGIPKMLILLITPPVVLVAKGSFFSLMNYIAK